MNNANKRTNYIERTCVQCGRKFRGTNAICKRCRTVERECSTCGRTFRGAHLICPACRTTDRQCGVCGRAFRHLSSNICTTCKIRALAPEVRSAIRAAEIGRRRARMHAAQVAGPIPAVVYAAVLASGPCVYCGAPAKHVDHITPLSRGGDEAAYNLVPACAPCNQRKHRRLLSEWDPERVTYALARSSLVRAQYAYQMQTEGASGIAAKPIQRPPTSPRKD